MSRVIGAFCKQKRRVKYFLSETLALDDWIIDPCLNVYVVTDVDPRHLVGDQEELPRSWHVVTKENRL